MRMRIVAVLATTAALIGAPSIASGAGNRLTSPTASPASGIIASIFTLTPDDEPEGGASDDPKLGIVLLVALSGAATVAIIGTTLVLVGRRRADDEEAAPVAELGDTDDLLERRTVRQAKVRLADDPIVTAMGVDDQVAARRRRGAGQVGSGPGERTVGGR